MTPLLRNLLGNPTKDRELTDEARALLHEMQQERNRFEALIQTAGSSVSRLEQLGEPMAKATSDMDALKARLADLQNRFTGMVQVTEQYQTLEDRAQKVERGQDRATKQID